MFWSNGRLHGDTTRLNQDLFWFQEKEQNEVSLGKGKENGMKRKTDDQSAGISERLQVRVVQ